MPRPRDVVIAPAPAAGFRECRGRHQAARLRGLRRTASLAHAAEKFRPLETPRPAASGALPPPQRKDLRGLPLARDRALRPLRRPLVRSTAPGLPRAYPGPVSRLPDQRRAAGEYRWLQLNPRAAWVGNRNRSYCGRARRSEP